MKRNLTILILLLSLFSCEKIIDINLNEANPKIVIEANVHNNNEDCLVKISRTGNFFSPYSPDMIGGAKITLTNNTSEYSFTEISEGIYRLNRTSNLPVDTYTINIEIGDEQYNAVSQMPSKINISSINYEYVEKNYFQEAGYIVYFGIIDPIYEKNYYRAKYLLNGEDPNDADNYYIFSDELFNGKSVQTQLYGKRFEENDTIEIELMSIDKSTYDYFNTLIKIIIQEDTESAAPTNPNSNLSNGALGYFSAYSSDKKTIIIGDTSK